MTDSYANYANYKNNHQPISPPIISSILTNVFKNVDLNASTKAGYQTLESGYPHYHSQGKCCTCNNVTRSTIWHK